MVTTARTTRTPAPRTPAPRTKTVGRGALLAAALAVSVAVAGCAGAPAADDVASLSGDAATPATTARRAATPEEAQDAMRAFATCMREHGIDMPDPKPATDGAPGGGLVFGGPGDGGDTPDRHALEEAHRACEPLVRDAIGEGPGPIDPEEAAKMQESALAFAKCMREHGIDMPDPKVQDGGAISLELKADPDDPAFQEAQKACQESTGGFGPPGPARAKPGDAQVQGR